jgi:hypothetical protein
VKPARKLLAFVAVLVAVFAGAYAVGAAVPDVGGDTPATTVHTGSHQP